MKQKQKQLIGHWTLIKETLVLPFKHKGVFLLPILAITLWIVLLFAVLGISIVFTGAVPSDTAAGLIGFATVLITTPFVLCAGPLVLSGKQTAFGAIQETLQRGKEFIGLLVLYFLIIIVSYLPVVLQKSFNYQVPSIDIFLSLTVTAILIYTTVFFYTFIHEHLSAFEALKKSYLYIRKRWWKVATRTILFFAVIATLAFLSGIVVLGITFAFESALVLLGALFIGFVLLPPILMSFSQILYDDLKRTSTKEVKEVKREAKRYVLLLLTLAGVILLSGMLLIGKGTATVSTFFLSTETSITTS